MTVAAVIVPAGAEAALAEASGRAAVRRIVESAWAGGALPIVVVVADADGRVAAALGGSPAAVLEPGSASGAAAYRLGAEAAGAAVRETSAVLLWPGSMTWTDPETVTSLIEAHGRASQTIYRPERAGQAGWPALLPVARLGEVLEGASARASVAEAVAAAGVVGLELGDPGTVMGAEVPLDELPGYDGPPEPVGGPPPEWGAAVAEGAGPDGLS